jgi:hypothetical protein
MKKDRSLIFHIGLEKTGTTSFQQFCSDQTRLMSFLGIHYPKQDAIFYDNNHSPLTASYLPENARSFVSPDCFISNDLAVSQLRLSMTNEPHHKTLISSELFSSRFSNLDVKRLADDFARYRPKIIVVVRDHYSLIRGAYSTEILSGSRFTMTDFISALWNPTLTPPPFPDVSFRYCRYREIIKPWETHFGKDNVRILKYQGATSLALLLSEILEQPIALPAFFQDNYNLNQSSTPLLLDYVRQFNRILPNWNELFNAEKLPLWPSVCEKRWDFLSLISDIVGPANDRTDYVFGEGDRDKIAGFAASDHDWLSERGIQLVSDVPAATPDNTLPRLRPDLCAILDSARPPDGPNEQAPDADSMERRIAQARAVLATLEGLRADRDDGKE